MNICVYGASSAIIDQSYMPPAEHLGELMAERGYGLVFGGGATGMMGTVARGAHRKGGKIIGVAPSFFNVDGILFQECTEFIYTETMRERKQTMEDLSDAFIITPGSIGTFEEFFEILTLKQLGRHKKPIVILDINGYYDPLLKMFDNAVEKSFMAPICRTLFDVVTTAEDALTIIEDYEPEDFDIIQLRSLT